MGKKGAKRKTRWRTLSIGTPPGEEDEEEGSRNGYLIKSGHESGRSERNGYGPPWLKSRHGSAGSSGSGNSNGQASHAGSTTSGYASGGSRSRRTCSDGHDSPTQQQQQQQHNQQRIVFNEDEYTRITTPRQDMLFKKGYLGQKKQWTPSNASMSATPSTTESQSASHSTADGSEAAEDQQLLDSGGVPAEYAPQLMEAVPPGPAQLSYGTYYDHTSGYFYEYPMMLVGPALPDEMGQPNMLAAMPCAPVPLRPIEWVNPAFVPKLASQQYCYMDYQGVPPTDCAGLVDAQGLPICSPDSLIPTTNGLSNEASLTGGSASVSASASASGSIADEPLANNKATLPATQVQENQPDQDLSLEQEELMQEVEGDEDEEKPTETEEPLEEAPMDGLEYPEAAAAPYVETLPPQPVHLAHMMPPPMGHQPAYLYPGQYMFGPPVVNVNGVTIQSGPMLRCNDMLASTAAVACAKRRKKKRKRKQKRPHALGNTEDEDEEDYSSEGENGLPSPRVSLSAAPTTTGSLSNRPLNPECQEFHLRSDLANSTPESFSDSCGTSSIAVTMTTTTSESNGEAAPEEDCNSPAVTLNNHQHHADNEEATTRLTDEPAETAADVHSKDLENGMDHKLPNGCDEEEKTEKQEEEEEAMKSSRMSNGGITTQPRRKYSAKALKFVREPTPGPDLDDETNNHEEAQRDVAVDELTLVLSRTTIIEAQASQNDADLDISRSRADEESPTPIASESCCDEMKNHETTTKTTTTTLTGTITAADEDSGFESQSKHGYSDRPITDAVNEWLKRANSPDLFITSSATSDEDEEDDEDASISNEPSKNLQGNPMPALSANGAGAEKREASRGRVAETGESSTGSSNDEAVRSGGPSLKGSRNVRGARRKGAKSHRRNQESQFLKLDTQQNKLDKAQEQAQVSVETSKAPPGKALEGICDSAEKDRDVGMRVAENSRINVRRLQELANSTVIRKAPEEACKEICVGDVQAVKTFEKGEIVVSMDGELLLVASELREKDAARRNSDSTLEDEHRNSLGSIEEPDVLECWEAETVEPVMSPKKTLDADENDEDDLLVTKDNGPDGMEHVQRYYRLQADSSVSSVEDETRDNLVINDNFDASRSKTVPNTPDPMTDSISSIEDIPVIVPVEDELKSITDYHSKLPIDEAFEVYESCYTGKPLNFTSIDPKFDKSPFMSRDGEGPIPCKAVCCNIQ
ncbi:uncharacterized protein LOC100678667 isoform X2 [Nasonia vitripennis]|uniref:Uncharacterized protein n=1 Tax=Nasonia vitripennis TaxID=7425 RepID=A0A7M7GDS1_NASVI|nr:uncharacterized protein LOC100678667 isoform X2 [Nasonia vitripennis]